MTSKEQLNCRKNSILREKLAENIAKPEELWQTLKSLVLPNKKNKFSIYLPSTEKILHQMYV